MRLALLALLCPLAVGCDDHVVVAPDPSPRAPANGSARLAVEYLEAPGGAAIPRRLFDHELDVACVPRVTRDGATRCVPDERLDIEASAIVYSSPECSPGSEVLGVRSDCGEPRWILTGADVSCAGGSAYDVWRLGVEVGELWWRLSDTCEPYSPEEGYSWRAAKLVDPGTLVELVPSIR